MDYTVVTGFSAAGYEQYGRSALESFARFWPDSVGQIVYMPSPAPEIRGLYVNSLVPNGLKEFVDRHKDDPTACGKIEGRTPWAEKYRRSGYNYRLDAVRFCWQLFYCEHAINTLPDDGIMVWLDGDVITTDDVSLSPLGVAIQGYDIAHLGRTRTQTELGVWIARANPATREFLRQVCEYYRSDRLFELPQWHSGFVFDHVLQTFPGKVHNLTNQQSGEVFRFGPLGNVAVHLKGKLKEQCASS